MIFGASGLPFPDSPGGAYPFDIAPEPAGCNAMDPTGPLGTLDFSDVLAFATAFATMGPAADLAPPTGVLDFTDVIAFLLARWAGAARRRRRGSWRGAARRISSARGPLTRPGETT